MPTAEDLLLLDEIASLMKKQYADFRGVYFFGSRMSGTHTAESDYDILPVFEREINYSFKREIRDMIYEIMLKYDVVIDTKIFSESDIQHPRMPFTEEVKNSGYYYAV